MRRLVGRHPSYNNVVRASARFAEQGLRSDAVKMAREAHTLALSAGRTDLAQRLENQLAAWGEPVSPP